MLLVEVARPVDSKESWYYAGRCSGRTRTEAWDEAKVAHKERLPSAGGETQRARLVPASAWGKAVTLIGRQTFELEVVDGDAT